MDIKSFKAGAAEIAGDLAGLIRTSGMARLFMLSAAAATTAALVMHFGAGSAATDLVVEASKWGASNASPPMAEVILTGAFAAFVGLASRATVAFSDMTKETQVQKEAYRGKLGLRHPVSGGAEVSSGSGLTGDEKLALEKLWSDHHGKYDAQHLMDKCEGAMEVMSAQGDPKAQYDLGQHFLAGADYEKALPLLESAVIQGSGGAAYQLSQMYYKGLGVEADQSKGLALIEMACERGDSLALHGMAQMYEKGVGGVASDLASAERCYERAIDRGSVSSLTQLTDLRTEMKASGIASENVATLSKQANDHGIRESQFKLGMLYYSGVQVDKDHSKALEYLDSARQQGHGLANSVLAQMKLGEGMASGDMDTMITGLRNLKIAANLDNSAKAMVGNLYEKEEFVRVHGATASPYEAHSSQGVDAERAAKYRKQTEGMDGLVDVLPKSADEVESSSMTAFDAFYASNGYASGALGQQAEQEVDGSSAKVQAKPSGFKFG